ncbi:hypothetical protein QJS04_geneDACA006393 [Acorus gramineus]|uniref:Uncharacterized protein n=1 Tax=Acorus gramineus TaxID=55184 RepID=A0AAV9AUM4_ACOGR|nr:hypothetical protein QJS04_geneDACA006393 [Acorus gramineus]
MKLQWLPRLSVAMDEWIIVICQDLFPIYEGVDIYGVDFLNPVIICHYEDTYFGISNSAVEIVYEQMSWSDELSIEEIVIVDDLMVHQLDDFISTLILHSFAEPDQRIEFLDDILGGDPDIDMIDELDDSAIEEGFIELNDLVSPLPDIDNSYEFY